MDRLVSGVLLLARSSAVASDVCNLILQCKVTKEYVARVKVRSHDTVTYTYTPPPPHSITLFFFCRESFPVAE